MPEKNRDDDVGTAELGQMAVGTHDLNNRVTPEVPVEVLGDDDRDGEVLAALEDVAWDGDKAEKLAHITLEDGLGDTEGNVWADVEEGAAELLDRHRVHVASNRERGEAGDPCLVVGSHGFEELLQVFVLEPSKVVHVIQIPEDQPPVFLCLACLSFLLLQLYYY